MCGIAGIFHPDRPSASTDDVERMIDSLRHRGPDAGSTWTDPDLALTLGHRRLSVIDLREIANQPMHHHGHVIVYNGEVYNYAEIARDLRAEGVALRTSGDTEVVVAAIAHWGIESAIQRFIGMFAFAVWDRAKRILLLARDRLGIKPLYYGRVGDRFVFASELSAILAIDGFTAKLCRDAVAAYFVSGFVPAPLTIVENVRKLRPGHVLSVASDGSETERPYWDIHEIAGKNTNVWEGKDLDIATEALDELLNDAVSKRLISDVPIGGFLSGGTDSSLVTALMVRQSSSAVRTFSIGFRNPRYDEAPYARAVAEYLGTDHSETYVDEADLLKVAPSMADVYDEPFADSSQIPTFIVSEIARRHVTVCLSGDGGDELFCGYSRYSWAATLHRYFSLTPAPVRRGLLPLARAALQFSARMPRLSSAFTPSRRERLEGAISSKDWQTAFDALGCVWPGGAAPLHEEFQPEPRRRRAGPSPLETLMMDDLTRYLPDDILTKVDRASMRVSLEARVPLLDHRIVEFAVSLPLRWKYAAGKTKIIERKLLSKYVPDHLVERPKKGFSVPLAAWLRGPLTEWAGELLSEEALAESGVFDVRAVREIWSKHLKGTDYHTPLWFVLMFQAWHQKWRHKIAI